MLRLVTRSSMTTMTDMLPSLALDARPQRLGQAHDRERSAVLARHRDRPVTCAGRYAARPTRID
jgi:hypothetical protein